MSAFDIQFGALARVPRARPPDDDDYAVSLISRAERSFALHAASMFSLAEERDIIESDSRRSLSPLGMSYFEMPLRGEDYVAASLTF